jgi:hypothetical protein
MPDRVGTARVTVLARSTLGARAFAHPCMGTVKRELRSGSKLLAPHAPIEGVDHGPMSVIPFLRIVSLFDLEPFLRPDPRVSPRRRAQLRSRLAVAGS